MNTGHNFLDGFGAHFPQRSAMILHREGEGEETRHQLKCLLDPSKRIAKFNLTDPVYKGDVLELEDPRGGTERFYVIDVIIHDNGNDPNFSRFSHLEVSYSRTKPSSVAPSPNGSWIQVTGDGNQITVGSHSVSQNTQSFTISTEHSSLVDAVKQALAAIEDASPVSEEEKEVARESSKELIAELSKEDPNRSALHRALAAIKGILGSIMMTATETGSKEIAQQLFEQLQLP